jgi:phospholipid-transporting ATPase
MEIVSLVSLLLGLDANLLDSAKRMYRPQTYHHIQEIQKYNIQDYRPRYVIPIICHYNSLRQANAFHTGWNNSKKQSARSAKCSVCASNVAMPSRKQTSPRREFCKHTIPQGREGDMEKWQVRGPKADEGHYDV